MPTGIYRHKPLSEEHKRKTSVTMKIKGQTLHLWKDGRFDDPKYASWIRNKRNRLKRYVVGVHSFEEWGELKKQHNYICLFCKKQEPEIQLTEDHIVPLSKGGTDDIGNIQPLCRSCNSRKGNRITS